MTAVTLQSLAVLFVSGIAVGALIDGVRILKGRLPFAFAKYGHFLLEFSVWICCGIGTFYLLYSWQGGHWRWVNFLAQVMGLFIYDRYLFRIIRLIVGRIVYSIIIPIRFLISLIWEIILLLFRFISFILGLFAFRRTR